MEQRILAVTGASGTVGAHLLTEAAQSQRWDQIVGLYRRESSRDQTHSVLDSAVAQRVTWRQVDLLDPTAVEEALVGVTHLVHAAARVGFAPQEYAAMLRENPRTAELVFNQARHQNMRAAVHISSIAVLADKPDRSMYGHSKAAAEQEAFRNFAEGLPLSVIRPGVILTPALWEEGSSQLVRTAARGLPVSSPGATGWVDARDVAASALHVLEELDQHGLEAPAAGQSWVCVGANRPFHEVFTDIAEAFGNRPPRRSASPWLLAAAWRLEAVAARLTGRLPRITRDSVKASISVQSYNGQPLTAYLPGGSYRSWEETVKGLRRSVV
jgi:nucleoside-diphosphate-sugar epimerase